MDLAAVKSIEFSQLADALTSHPTFGDASNILSAATAMSRAALDFVTSELGAEPALAEGLARLAPAHAFEVQTDPVIRHLLTEAVKNRPLPDARAAAIAALNGLSLSSNPAVDPLAGVALPRFGSGASAIRVWTSSAAPSAWGGAFVALFEREIAHSVSSQAAALVAPTPEQLATIEAGYGLLEQLVPELAASLLAHVRLVGVIDYADESERRGRVRSDLCQNVSTHSIASTIFLSPSPLRTVWHAAEAMLHEATHKKLSDLVLTQEIFPNGYDTESSAVITAIWNRSLSWNPTDWPVDRAIYALHYYAHAAAFHDAVVRNADVFEPSHGPLPFDARSLRRAAVDRALYLGRELRSIGWDWLGEDGRALVEWLMAEIEPLSFWASDNVEFALLMDRFDRETDEIARMIAGFDGDGASQSQWQSIVAHILQSELVGAFRIHSVLGESAPPTFSHYDGDTWSLRIDYDAYPAPVLAGWFRALREMTSAALRGAPADAENLLCQTRRRKTLRDLVDDAVGHVERHRLELSMRSRGRR